MKRTITKNLSDRLLAQAEEAKTIGLTKLASTVETNVIAHKVRKDDEWYSYASSDFQEDVQAAIWQAVIRVADFYNCSLDIKSASETVNDVASRLIYELRVKAGVDHGVGAYEPPVPGELKSDISIDITDLQDE